MLTRRIALLFLLSLSRVRREIVFQLCRDHQLEQLKESMDFHAHLAFLLDILNQGTFHDMPIFFILDDFHLFTQRTKQTLLYNLCDLLQSEKAQICIIGLTPNLDCYDQLEKRIRSRMSHRRILMGPQRPQQVDADGQAVDTRVNLKTDQQKRYDQLVQILKACLELPEPALTPKPAQEMKTQGKPRNSSGPSAARNTSTYVSEHNAAIGRLLSPRDSPRLHALIAFHLYNCSVAFFQRVFKLALCASMGPRHTQLLEEDVIWAIKYLNKDWTREALKRQDNMHNNGDKRTCARSSTHSTR
jgi:hypothetical protein